MHAFMAGVVAMTTRAVRDNSQLVTGHGSQH